MPEGHLPAHRPAHGGAGRGWGGPPSTRGPQALPRVVPAVSRMDGARHHLHFHVRKRGGRKVSVGLRIEAQFCGGFEHRTALDGQALHAEGEQIKAASRSHGRGRGVLTPRSAGTLSGQGSGPQTSGSPGGALVSVPQGPAQSQHTGDAPGVFVE